MWAALMAGAWVSVLAALLVDGMAGELVDQWELSRAALLVFELAGEMVDQWEPWMVVMWVV